MLKIVSIEKWFESSNVLRCRLEHFYCWNITESGSSEVLFNDSIHSIAVSRRHVIQTHTQFDAARVCSLQQRRINT